MEVKKIADSDLEILKELESSLDKYVRSHSKLRLQFLRAEAVIIQNLAKVEGELNQFAKGLALSLGVEESDLENWKLDIDLGSITKVSEPIVEAEQTTPEMEAIEIDPNQRLLDEMRKKYKR